MSEYLQDKNAGNAGDYLKHLLLLKLIEGVLKEYPGRSIAYIESHAGAGLYNLEETHWKYRYKYRKLICGEDDQWTTFERLNSKIDKGKVYYGSFVLAGKLLLENRNFISKMVLYEYEKDNKKVFERMVAASDSLLLELKPEPLNIESSPEIIKDKIKETKSLGSGIVICLIDPYFKDGKKDSIWCEVLSWDDPDLFILMFDTWNLQHDSHCLKGMLIRAGDHNLIKNPIPYQIRGYGIYGNKQSRNILTNIK